LGDVDARPDSAAKEPPEEEREANDDLAADEDAAELFELVTCDGEDDACEALDDALEEVETLPLPPKCALLLALAWPPPPPLRCARAGVDA
jgi:hypothetical protein